MKYYIRITVNNSILLLCRRTDLDDTGPDPFYSFSIKDILSQGSDHCRQPDDIVYYRMSELHEFDNEEDAIGYGIMGML